jgi:hypothetical protein
MVSLVCSTTFLEFYAARDFCATRRSIALLPAAADRWTTQRFRGKGTEPLAGPTRYLAGPTASMHPGRPFRIVATRRGSSHRLRHPEWRAGPLQPRRRSEERKSLARGCLLEQWAAHRRGQGAPSCGTERRCCRSFAVGSVRHGCPRTFDSFATLSAFDSASEDLGWLNPANGMRLSRAGPSGTSLPDARRPEKTWRRPAAACRRG